MDTGSDFIRPEFLNIIFFQQKNLVIFPHIDIKHLHSLELFTAGFNVVDLETTALHNLKEILEFETNSSYSQNPTLFFIYNADSQKIKEIMELKGLRCIMNASENVKDLADGNAFIFFNKKNNQFLNYDLSDSELEFENHLISSSENEAVLQDKIQKIKTIATRVFTELNQKGNLDDLAKILGDYHQKYWTRILDFTSNYFDVNVPQIDVKQVKKVLLDFSEEYETCVSTNRTIGRNFVKHLHDYRSKRVNPSHLELEELYNPRKLYNYLRNHHWKDGIPDDFIQEWMQMDMSEADQIDLELILNNLEMNQNLTALPPSEPSSSNLDLSERTLDVMPSLKDDFNGFKQWLLNQIGSLEGLINELLENEMSPDLRPYLLKELSMMSKLFEIDSTKNARDPIKEEIISRLKQVDFMGWVELCKIKPEKFKFVVRFIARLGNFHDKMFGKDDEKDMPLKIKEFCFPSRLEKQLLSMNLLRNKITHKEMNLERMERVLMNAEHQIDETFFLLLAHLIKEQLTSMLESFHPSGLQKRCKELQDLVIKTYFKEDMFSTGDIEKIRELLDGQFVLAT